MAITIAVVKESQPHERRVAMFPAVADQLMKMHAEIRMQAGAGDAANLVDARFRNVKFIANPHELVSDADVVLAVQRPAPNLISAMKPGAILISFVYAEQEPEILKRLLDKRITCFAMERIPRISRAQAMDALSSQAALAGYYAVLLGATHMSRILPMMTTAVGALRPATVLVMGVGVAGLQALATARRLGALLEAYDIRPETKEEAESLGAKFIATDVNADAAGGYARQSSEDGADRAARTLTRHIQKADLIVTSASVPGRPAPILISRSQVDGMKAGAVIVDLASDSGGNCESSHPGDTVQVGPVTIIAPLNVPSLLPEHASELYAKNQYNLLKLMMKDGALQFDWEDEILSTTVLTHDGQINGRPGALPEILEPVRSS